MTSDLSPLVDRVRPELATEPSTREVKMFSGLSFMVNEKMVLAVRDSDLLVRVDPKRHDELVAHPGTATAEMGAGRSMGPGWINVAEQALTSDNALTFWAGVALDYNARVREARGER